MESLPSIGRTMQKIVFDFQYNPEKTIQPSTQKVYKQKLNSLTRNTLDSKGTPRIKNKTDILSNIPLVLDHIAGIKSKQGKSITFAAVFYAIGRQDFDADPRGLPLYNAFQSHYYTPEYKKRLGIE